MTLQQQLKEARTKAGLSLSGLADRIGIARNNVAAYETGKPPFDGISSKLLKKWATATGYTFTIPPELPILPDQPSASSHD